MRVKDFNGIRDQIRSGSHGRPTEIKKTRSKNLIMLSGDNQGTVDGK